MIPMLDWVTEPLRYEFMRRALVEVVIMGAVTGAIGCYVVLRGLAFMGDALSHAIFPGIALAFLLGRSIFLGALAFGVLTVVLIAIAATNRRVKEDSAIGVLFAGMFALGVVLIELVAALCARSGLISVRQCAGRHGLRHRAVRRGGRGGATAVGGIPPRLADHVLRPGGAAAMGVPVFWLDLLLLLLIALTIVVSLSAVGNILVLAMLITPAAAARLLTDRFPVMMGLSAAIGAGSGVLGLFVSYHHDLAAGGTIVLVATLAFGIVWLAAPTHGFVATRVWARRRAAAVRSGTPSGSNRSPDRGDPRRPGTGGMRDGGACGVDWPAWLDRWDAQQTGYIPERRGALRRDATMCSTSSFRPTSSRWTSAVGPGRCAAPSWTDSLGRAASPWTSIPSSDHGQRVHGTFGGRLHWVDADLRDPTGPGGFETGSVDAVLSTTALPWLAADKLTRVYRQLGALVREGGVVLNGDTIRFGPRCRPSRRVAAVLEERTRRRSHEAQAIEDWERWWVALEAEPGVADLFAERRAPLRVARPQAREAVLPRPIQGRRARSSTCTRGRCATRGSARWASSGSASKIAYSSRDS